MREHTIVSPFYTGLLCNRVLSTYRAFWFAAVHDIPFNHVLLPEDAGLVRCPLFANIVNHFVPQEKFQTINFTKRYNAWRVITDKQRRELFDMQFADGDNVEIREATFLYPERPWELSLFNKLFDNVALRHALTIKYGDRLSGSSIGFTIRRGDTVPLRNFRTLSADDVLHSFEDIIRNHNGLVKIFVGTDDVPYVEALLDHRKDIADYVVVLHEDPANTLVALSLCDHVINNGQYQTSSSYVDRTWPMLESTFGQIAQLLNKSYKHADFSSTSGGVYSVGHMGVDKSNELLAQSRVGGDFKYPTTTLEWG